MKTLLCALAFTSLTACGGPSFSGLTASPGADAPDGASVDHDAGRPEVGGQDDGGAAFSDAAGGTGGTDDGGSGGEAGGRHESGGATSSGGSLGAGGNVHGSGGATGGASSGGSGGVVDSGGTACELVTHTNGIGETWQDCAPLGTYDERQAMAACTAFCAANGCAKSSCHDVQANCMGGSGHSVAVQAVDLIYGAIVEGWVWDGPLAGYHTYSIVATTTCSEPARWN